MNKRPDIDEYFLEIAHVVAKRSTCLKRAVGAVLVRDKHIISTGYNGSPKGMPHCISCNRPISGVNHELCKGVHAEANAIIQAAIHGASVKGCTLYCTTFPCNICAKMLTNAGINDIIVEEEYDDPLSMQLLSDAGINVRMVKEHEKEN